MLSTLRGVAVLLVVWLLPPVALAAPLSADAVVQHTLAHHPDAVAARAFVDVAAADRREASVLLWNPDVEATVGIRGSTEVKVAQPFSPSGEGYAARSTATLERRTAELSERRSRVMLAHDARVAWVDAATAILRTRLTDEVLTQAHHLRAAAEARAAQGEASDLDVRLARLDEAHALSTALDARRDEAEARTALAAFHPDALTAELGDPLEGVPTPTQPSGERVDLTAARRATDAARAALAKARAAVVDPISLGVALDVGDGAVDAHPYVAWTLPLWTRNQGGVARARADLAVREAEVVQIERVVTANQATADQLARSAHADLSRLSDIDADARAALAAIEAGVQSGELDVSTAALLRAEVLDGWTSGLDARATTAKATLSQLLAHDDPALFGGVE